MVFPYNSETDKKGLGILMSRIANSEEYLMKNFYSILSDCINTNVKRKL